MTLVLTKTIDASYDVDVGIDLLVDGIRKIRRGTEQQASGLEIVYFIVHFEWAILVVSSLSGSGIRAVSNRMLSL